MLYIFLKFNAASSLMLHFYKKNKKQYTRNVDITLVNELFIDV